MALAGRWGTHENGACSEHIPEMAIDMVSCFFPSSNSKVTMQDGIWIRSCVSRYVRVEVALREVKKKKCKKLEFCNFKHLS